MSKHQYSHSLHADLLQELADEYGFSFDILKANLDERSIGDRAEMPEQLVKLLAKAKADALMPQLQSNSAQEKPAFLITCDQVVVHKGRILEKPQTADEVSFCLFCLPTYHTSLHTLCITKCSFVPDYFPPHSLQAHRPCAPIEEELKRWRHLHSMMQARQFISGYSEAPPSTLGSVLVQHISSGGQYLTTDSATVHFRPIPDDVIEQLIQEGTVFSCAGAGQFAFLLLTTCHRLTS